MPKTIPKTAFFLELALQGQQFPLVIFDREKSKQQTQELKDLINKNEILTVNEVSFNDVLEEAQNPGPDLFEKGAPDKFTLMRIDLNKKELKKALNVIAQLRFDGTFEMNGKKNRLPDYMKFLFTIENETLKELPDDIHEKALYIFSPIYRFENK